MQAAPPMIVRERGRGALLLWLGIALAAASGVILFFFNPAANGFYPQWFFHMVTGWDCPGCGGLRSTHQLLHGHLREALALNPLFVISLPLIGYFIARSAMKALTGREWPQPFRSTAWIWVGAAIVVTFGILRNLPWRIWFGS